MLKEFNDIDPITPSLSGHVLASQPSSERPGETYHFVAVDQHIIIASCEFKKPWADEPASWYVSQIVVPKRGISWFVDTIENKFTKTPAEGGLSAEEFKQCETIEGEELEVRRSFGTPGYVFSTISRRTERGFALELLFTDEFLFEHGLFGVFKRIAEQVRRGEI